MDTPFKWTALTRGLMKTTVTVYSTSNFCSRMTMSVHIYIILVWDNLIGQHKDQTWSPIEHRWDKHKLHLHYPSNCANWNCELKIRPLKTHQFRENSHISQKRFYAHMRLFFRHFEKGIFHKTAIFFNSFTGHLAHVKSHDYSLIYYNLQ